MKESATAAQNPTIIKMVDQALTVLDTLRMSRESLGVNEIAKMCGINPSTTFRILKTLEVNGWAFQCSDRRYIVGEKIGFVIEKNNLYLALKEVSSFVMNRYTEKYNQAMNLTVREGLVAIFYSSPAPKPCRLYSALYSDLPFMHAQAENSVV